MEKKWIVPQNKHMSKKEDTFENVDESKEFYDVKQNFDALALLPPEKLMVGNILDPNLLISLNDNTPNSRENLYHAIVTDPPYGMKEKAFMFDLKTKDDGIMNDGKDTMFRQSNETKSHIYTLIEALVDKGSSALVPSGRLVFFLPIKYPKVKAKMKKESILKWEETLITWGKGELNIISFQEQYFSDTFSRFLVVMEKKKLSK